MNLTDNNFLESVETYTNSLLQRKDDTKKIIHIAAGNNKKEQFERLAFTAKYISGMVRVLKTAPGIPEVSSLDQIKNDLNENIKKAVEQLKEIISFSDATTQEYFEKNYFNLSSQNFKNLSQLFSDLESVKKYLNYLKRNS
jgi:transcriptional regulator of heat shock response